MRLPPSKPLYVYRKAEINPLVDPLLPIRVVIEYAPASLRGHRYTAIRLRKRSS